MEDPVRKLVIERLREKGVMFTEKGDGIYVRFPSKNINVKVLAFIHIPGIPYYHVEDFAGISSCGFIVLMESTFMENVMLLNSKEDSVVMPGNHASDNLVMPEYTFVHTWRA